MAICRLPVLLVCLSTHDVDHSRHQPGLRCPESCATGWPFAQRMARMPFLSCSPPGTELVSGAVQAFPRTILARALTPLWGWGHPLYRGEGEFGSAKDPQPEQLESIEALQETQICWLLSCCKSWILFYLCLLKYCFLCLLFLSFKCLLQENLPDSQAQGSLCLGHPKLTLVLCLTPGSPQWMVG